MSSHAVNHFNAIPAEQWPSGQSSIRDTFPAAAWAPFGAQQLMIFMPAARRLEARKPEGSCIKGLLVALSVEAVMVAASLGAWQLWHLIR